MTESRRSKSQKECETFLAHRNNLRVKSDYGREDETGFWVLGRETSKLWQDGNRRRVVCVGVCVCGRKEILNDRTMGGLWTRKSVQGSQQKKDLGSVRAFLSNQDNDWYELIVSYQALFCRPYPRRDSSKTYVSEWSQQNVCWTSIYILVTSHFENCPWWVHKTEKETSIHLLLFRITKP